MNKHRCWAEISQGAIAYNVKGLIDYLPENTKSIAIIKADGYGHGIVSMAKYISENGIHDFGVASYDEAKELRDNGNNDEILILDYIDKDLWGDAVAINAIFTVISPQHAIELNNWCVENNQKIRAEIKVDTGMRRIGIDSECNDEDIKVLYGQSNLLINGTYSHLSIADSFDKDDIAFTKLQNERFSNFLTRVQELGYTTGRTHLSASPGFLNYPEYQYDYVRPGYVLYGYNGSSDVNQGYDRKPVMSLKAKIAYVKTVEENEPISYGRIYITDKKCKIATVMAGYGDGYPRNISEQTYVLLHDKKCKVVGRVCMDQIMIDVTDIDEVKVEDVVTLFGNDETTTLPIEQLAKWADTNPSEIVCRIPNRVKRFIVD